MRRPAQAAAPRAAAHGMRPAAVVTVVAAILFTCGPLFLNPALPRGSDVYSTTHYLQGFMKAFGEGDLYPRWTDRTNQDLGAPSFVMFPPLTYYGAGALSWLLGSTIAGFKAWILVVCTLSALSFYALARSWAGPGLPAAAGAAAYLMLPYHVLDIYQRFAMSETAAFIFFPLILLAARRVIEAPTAGWFAGLAASYAGLICTHIVSALPFSLLLGAWLLWESRLRWRALVRAGLGLTCGLALAAPALLPAVLEKQEVNIAWNREMPNGDFRINFIFRDDVLPVINIKDPVKPPVLRSAHSQLLLGLAAAALVIWSGAGAGSRTRRDALAMGAGCLIAYLMQVEISTFVWRIVPELASIQFPWRLQTIMVLTASLLLAMALARMSGPEGRKLAAPGAGVFVVLGAVNLALAYQNAHLKPFTFDAAAAQDQSVIHWIEPAFTPRQFEGYRTFRQTRVEMPRVALQGGAGEALVRTWESSRREITIDSPSGGSVIVRSFWFPGWSATIDGAPLEIRPSAPLAAISFDAPPGRHTVRLEHDSTPARDLAAAALAAGIPLTLLLAWLAPRRLAG